MTPVQTIHSLIKNQSQILHYFPSCKGLKFINWMSCVYFANRRSILILEMEHAKNRRTFNSRSIRKSHENFRNSSEHCSGLKPSEQAPVLRLRSYHQTNRLKFRHIVSSCSTKNQQNQGGLFVKKLPLRTQNSEEDNKGSGPNRIKCHQHHRSLHNYLEAGLIEHREIDWVKFNIIRCVVDEWRKIEQLFELMQLKINEIVQFARRKANNMEKTPESILIAPNKLNLNGSVIADQLAAQNQPSSVNEFFQTLLRRFPRHEFTTTQNNQKAFRESEKLLECFRQKIEVLNPYFMELSRYASIEKQEQLIERLLTDDCIQNKGVVSFFQENQKRQFLRMIADQRQLKLQNMEEQFLSKISKEVAGIIKLYKNSILRIRNKLNTAVATPGLCWGNDSEGKQLRATVNQINLIANQSQSPNGQNLLESNPQPQASNDSNIEELNLAKQRSELNQELNSDILSTKELSLNQVSIKFEDKYWLSKEWKNKKRQKDALYDGAFGSQAHRKEIIGKKRRHAVSSFKKFLHEKSHSDLLVPEFSDVSMNDAFTPNRNIKKSQKTFKQKSIVQVTSEAQEGHSSEQLSLRKSEKKIGMQSKEQTVLKSDSKFKPKVSLNKPSLQKSQGRHSFKKQSTVSDEKFKLYQKSTKKLPIGNKFFQTLKNGFAQVLKEQANLEREQGNSGKLLSTSSNTSIKLEVIQKPGIPLMASNWKKKNLKRLEEVSQVSIKDMLPDQRAENIAACSQLKVMKRIKSKLPKRIRFKNLNFIPKKIIQRIFREHTEIENERNLILLKDRILNYFNLLLDAGVLDKGDLLKYKDEVQGLVKEYERQRRAMSVKKSMTHIPTFKANDSNLSRAARRSHEVYETQQRSIFEDMKQIQRNVSLHNEGKKSQLETECIEQNNALPIDFGLQQTAFFRRFSGLNFDISYRVPPERQQRRQEEEIQQKMRQTAFLEFDGLDFMKSFIRNSSVLDQKNV